MDSEHFKINFDEKFLHLSKAPIKEAVIEIRGRASVSWNDETLRSKLKTELPDYPKQQSGRAQIIELTPQKEQKVTTQDLGWQGLTLTSKGEKYIAKYHINLFSLSRLHPYEDWNCFINEAKRLWEIHFKLARPLEIQRLGVRFINRIQLSHENIQLEDYFIGFSSDIPAIKLNINGFLHHDIFSLPGFPYMMNIIKTIQPKTASQDPALILDIDVYTQQPFEPKREMIDQKLLDLHWLKNKIFFSSITPKLIEQLK
jgi:uncharacterized protein (TIGR04255 family)